MESEELLPIQTPPMVVKDRMTGVQSVLSRPDRHTAQLRPPALNALAIHTTGTLCIVDVVLDLAAFSMAGQMELRDDNLPVGEGVEVEGQRNGILRHP